MRARHPKIPRFWLMTDERLGNAMWKALRALPRGGGVVFRHYSLPYPERRSLFRRVRQIAAVRQLTLLRAGPRPMPGEHGTHGVRGMGLNSRAVHDAREAKLARQARADLIFVSPIFATASHPGAPVLGVRRATRLRRMVDTPGIALGGMDAQRFKRVAATGFHGWAAIDAWSGKKRPRR